MPEKKTAVLMTVGTSLMEALRRADPNLRASDDEALAKDPCWTTLWPKACGPGEVQGFKQQLCSNDLWTIRTNAGFPSAEIQSFCFWLDAQPEDVKVGKVVLLPTNTRPARKCAEAVKGILTKAVFQSGKFRAKVTEPCPVEEQAFEVDPSNEDKFAQNMADFLKMVNERLDKLDSQGFALKVVNITGGYKVLAPLFALYGFQREDVEVIYQHEDSKVVLRVPPVPMAWDLKLLDEYRSLLGRGHLTHPPPARFRAFFRQEQNGWAVNAFGKMLQELYQGGRLQRFGYGARLIDRWLTDDQAKKDMRDRIARWTHIWIGDLIPETVEHSRGHSQRLMEYAAELLEPILEQEPNFLNEDELLCLICCLWLHDIGHTGLRFLLPREPMSARPSQDVLLRFKCFLAVCGLRDGSLVKNCGQRSERFIDIARFPSLLRLFHNFLSAQRICDPHCDYLPACERDAVALISMYDRKGMPLQGDELWKDGEALGLVAPALDRLLADNDGIEFRNSTLRKDRVMLLCALLRVIDGLDVQSDRIIDKDYWNERRRRTQEEVEYYERLLKQKLSASGLGTKFNSESSSALSVTADNVSDELGRVVRLVAETLNTASNGDKEAALEVLSLFDRALFKKRQEDHFFKHSQVKLTHLTRQNPGQRPFTFGIHLVFAEGAREDLKKDVAAEIWGEVEAVHSCLRKNGICFEGVFDGGTDGRKLMPADGGGGA